MTASAPKADHETAFNNRPWFMRIAGPLANRPRLLAGIVVGILIWVALVLIPNDLRPSTRGLLAWDSGVAVFCISMLLVMATADDRNMRVRAQTQDEGQHFILGLVLVAAMISVGAIAKELSLAKADHGLIKLLRVTLAFATVVLSWFLVQLVFALHYAHEYYSPDDQSEGEISGGLGFPDDEAPDYWDFLHFAVVIGVASQTADVTFKSKLLRRVGTVHSVIAFTFNTVVLALTINLLAGLF